MGLFGRKKAGETPDVTSIQHAHSMLERAKIGYKAVRNKPLRTQEGDNYKRYVENPEEWSRLEERMNAYFKYAIEVFPYRDGTEKTKLSRPKRFFTIQRDMVETCFPGGRKTGEPGDADLRDLLAALQLTVRHNLRHYYIIKRVLCELAAVAIITYFFQAYRLQFIMLKKLLCVLSMECPAGGSVALPSGVQLGICIGAVLLVVALAWFFNWMLHTLLLGALNVSCLFVDGQTAIRTKNLTNLIDDIIPRITDDQYVLRNAGKEKEWPERSRRWAILVYWLGKRLEFIERYIQIEIWLMRREHYWMNRAARVAFYLIAAGWLAVMAFIAIVRMHMGMGCDPMHIVAYFVAIAAGLTVLLVSYTNWSTPFSLLEDKLQPANWKRFCDVHLQEKFAVQIMLHQNEILKLDEQLSGH